MRFSNKAYWSMKCICFNELPELKTSSFFATSAIPFKDWFTSISFQYFCLVTNRCPIDRRQRIFLNDKDANDLSSQERGYFTDIVEAHVVSHFPCYLLTYDKLNNFFQNNSNGILKPSDIKTFEKEKGTNSKLDFSIVELEEDIKILLIPRFPTNILDGEVEVDFYVNDKETKKYLEMCAKERLGGIFGKITFEDDPGKFEYYYGLKRLIAAAINSGQITPLESGIK